MNYELAKELKEARFPQGHNNGEGGCPGNPDNDAACYHYSDDLAFLPTLSELREACGRDFRLQNSNPDLWQADNCGDFNTFRKGEHTVGVGSTPEEAVARLYLALNK